MNSDEEGLGISEVLIRFKTSGSLSARELVRQEMVRTWRDNKLQVLALCVEIRR